MIRSKSIISSNSSVEELLLIVKLYNTKPKPNKVKKGANKLTGNPSVDLLEKAKTE